jgi:hypothetical protein
MWINCQPPNCRFSFIIYKLGLYFDFLYSVVETYINTRGHDKLLRPDWRWAETTHLGMDIDDV